MHRSLPAIFGICAVAIQAAASDGPGTQTNSAAGAGAVSNDPVEKEYHQLLRQDDDAQAEVDKWIRDNQAFKENNAGVSDATLRARVEQRLASVHKSYEDFLQHHPDHVRARLAYGSFLMDSGEEDEAVRQMEKARELDPKNPAAWNNLANYYGHHGPAKKAFEYYAKASELNPGEPVYYQNLANTVYLFRPDAMEFYHLDEQRVFDKALELYRKAIRLDPDNFVLASDYAMTYYGIKPPRTGDALRAWNEALKIAPGEIEREGVYIHLARIQLHAGQFAEARRYLDAVTNAACADLKKQVARSLEVAANKLKGTNAPPAAVEPK